MDQGLQGVADMLAAQLGRSVLIGDRQYRLLAHTPATDVAIDEVRRRSILERSGPREAIDWVRQFGVERAHDPVRVPANPDIGMAARVCVPLWSQGLALGFLWLTDADETLTDAELELAVDAGHAAAAVLYREQVLRDLENDVTRHLMTQLLTGQPGDAAAAADELHESALFTTTGDVVTLVVSPVGGDEPGDDIRLAVATALDKTRRNLLAGYSLALVRSDHGALVVALGDPSLRANGVAPLAEQLRERTLKAIADGSWDAVVGIGTAVPLEAAGVSYAQATTATTLGAKLPDHGPVVQWDDLGIYRVLAHFPERHLDAAVPAELEGLQDEPHGAQLLETLETYLDLGCDAQHTAQVLQLHRASLYHRLRRIRTLTGLDLEDGEQRLMTHLGLKLMRLRAAHDK